MSRLDASSPSLKSAKRKINIFLHRQRWKKTLIFFAFVLLSFGFWYLQSLQQEYEIEKTIRIRYKNIPHEIVFADTVPDEIRVKIRDKGSVLLNYSFGRTFTPIEINMKDTPVNRGTVVLDEKAIESDIHKQLMTTTTLTGYEPAQINITYSKRMEKDLPVVFNGDIQYEPGFHLFEDMQITPAYVKVYAAESVLDTLTNIRTVYTEIKKADKTFTRALSLQKIEGVSINPETVTITVPIEQYTEKTLDIPVVITRIPDDYTVRLFPPTVEVTSSLPLNRYKDLEAEQFEIHIPFSELEDNLTGILPISLTKTPGWVRSSSISPDKIEFILEQHRKNN
ncbi:MAG: YbbR-like domain-containing protein [Tannerellaceae bacterium]|jgi:YbbR domain-containing protein|nr:YbbR-like domain-containing protein [Tannerellaceae bacterium]